MLVKIKKVKVKNNGYRREFLLESIYINADSIISICNYENLQEFLISEKSDLSAEKFSLVKIQEGNSAEEIIAVGSADAIFAEINTKHQGKELING